LLTDCRILMTGLTGQVGSAVARQLAEHNEVIGVARFSRPEAWEAVRAMGVEPVRCDYVEGDLRVVPDDVDYVVHMAADIDPVSFDAGVRQNAEGTGRLLHHCRRASGWFYTSTTGVYWDHPDPYHRYRETDRCGGSTRVTERFHYGTSKLMGEAVARSLSGIHGVPLVIARLNWSYGAAGTGGVPGIVADQVIGGTPVDVHADWPFVGSPIHEDDLAASIGPFLGAATVGGFTLNWAGDEAITNVELASYIGELVGKPPTIRTVHTAGAYPRATDNTLRTEVYGRCRIGWREGVRRMISERYPDIVLSSSH
jgi:UDP-glucuronate 4-epimerase